jgi:hypothetical protein
MPHAHVERRSKSPFPRIVANPEPILTFTDPRAAEIAAEKRW